LSCLQTFVRFFTFIIRTFVCIFNRKIWDKKGLISTRLGDETDNNIALNDTHLMIRIDLRVVAAFLYASRNNMHVFTGDIACFFSNP